MPDHVLPITPADAAWFTMNPRRPFRFRPAYPSEARAAGVETTDAVAIVARTCRGEFAIISRGAVEADLASATDIATMVDLDPEVATDLATHLPGVKPDALAAAATILLAIIPWCPDCQCSVRWTFMLASLAVEPIPASAPALAAMECEWQALRDRSEPSPFSPTDMPVVAASAALRAIGRTAI